MGWCSGESLVTDYQSDQPGCQVTFVTSHSLPRLCTMAATSLEGGRQGLATPPCICYGEPRAAFVSRSGPGSKRCTMSLACFAHRVCADFRRQFTDLVGSRKPALGLRIFGMPRRSLVFADFGQGISIGNPRVALWNLGRVTRAEGDRLSARW